LQAPTGAPPGRCPRHRGAQSQNSLFQGSLANSKRCKRISDALVDVVAYVPALGSPWRDGTTGRPRGAGRRRRWCLLSGILLCEANTNSKSACSTDTGSAPTTTAPAPSPNKSAARTTAQVERDGRSPRIDARRKSNPGMWAPEYVLTTTSVISLAASSGTAVETISIRVSRDGWHSQVDYLRVFLKHCRCGRKTACRSLTFRLHEKQHILFRNTRPKHCQTDGYDAVTYRFFSSFSFRFVR
jgi:hypothetical protein